MNTTNETDRIYINEDDEINNESDKYVYLKINDFIEYNSFHLDFGPYNIGSLYRFSVILHEILNKESNQGKAVVLCNESGYKARSNTACLLCCYMILVQSWTPHQVLQSITQCETPFMLFRDAGYSCADFEITIQDIVYGLWRAKERNLIDILSFDLEEYERYERIEFGDLNFITNDFIAFASPKDNNNDIMLKSSFKRVLLFFQAKNVKLVIRLNSHLYDAKRFTDFDIKHLDMIFDDGTCPPLHYVQRFIGASESIIKTKGKIAVHCKAGLGRTGCLIGAYLIYKHGFTANECIGYMRIFRPGMVVGPQQHWLYLHQNEIRDWRYTMILDNTPDPTLAGLYPLSSYNDFKARMRNEVKQKKISNKNKQGHPSSLTESLCNKFRKKRICSLLASKIQIAVPNQLPAQPRKYKYTDSSGSFVFNNSDSINDESIVNCDPELLDDSNKEKNDRSVNDRSVNDPSVYWNVLRSISVNNKISSQPLKNNVSTVSSTVSTNKITRNQI